MEHAQRDKMGKTKMKPIEVVLILILMEHAQRGAASAIVKSNKDVLILILMEHAQRVICTRVW